jgi:hypothetical protein
MGRHGARETLLTQSAAELTMPISEKSQSMLLGASISVLHAEPYRKRTGSDFALVIVAAPTIVVVRALIAMKTA